MNEEEEPRGTGIFSFTGGWGVGGVGPDSEGDSHGPSRKLLQRLPEAASVSDLRLTRGLVLAVVSEDPVLLLTPGFYGRERVGILTPLQGGTAGQVGVQEELHLFKGTSASVKMPLCC